MAKKRSENLREKIEEDILTGRLLSGVRLDEAALCNRFRVSRTPVREALLQLAAAGLVELRPHRGAIVSEITVQRLYEIFEVAAELEGMCGRLAARRMTPVEHDALVATHKDLEKAATAAESDNYFELNEAFHNLIAAGSHNEFLMEQVRVLRRRLLPFRRLKMRVRNRVSESFQEHKEMVDAILAGDGEHVDDLIRSHIVVRGERFGDLISIIAAWRSSQNKETSRQRRKKAE